MNHATAQVSQFHDELTSSVCVAAVCSDFSPATAKSVHITQILSCQKAMTSFTHKKKQNDKSNKQCKEKEHPILASQMDTGLQDYQEVRPQ